MLGVKLMLLGIALLLIANKLGDASIFVFMALGLIFVLVGLFIKDKKNEKDKSENNNKE